MNIDKLFDILLNEQPSLYIKENEHDIFNLIPELKESVGFNQNNIWHIYDVYEHILHVVDNVSSNIILRLTALFHDIGKPFVYTEDENVDPVGACVGTGGSRVKNVVDELFGEKIDITTWDEDPRILIKNVLSPAKVEEVMVDEDEKSAVVVVPDYQLSLAIGKEGQNVRLAAKLCGWKISICCASAR